MKKRIFLSISILSLLLLLVTAAVLLLSMYNEFIDERKSEIATEAEYIKYALAISEDSDEEYLLEAGRTSRNRLTLISDDGTVLFDSFEPAGTLENHLSRPEVSQALKTGTGSATRDSDTLGEKTYYYALLLDDGYVLRVAATMHSIGGVLSDIRITIAAVLILMVAASLLAAGAITRRVVAPINKINPEKPLEYVPYDELSPLLMSMDGMNRRIEAQMEELRQERDEFDRITSAMSDALVIFGSDKRVLTINKSARRMFMNFRPSIRNHLELSRDEGYLELVEDAFEGKNGELRWEKNGRIYRLTATCVVDSDKYAAVLMGRDITDKELSEQMRRDFSANVSHELKTPLTTVMGCAEIIRDGVAKPQDIAGFADKIHSEASRLLKLIEDIIRLSKLDEAELTEEFRQVDIYKIASDVVKELSQKAEKAGVSLRLEGEKAEIKGIPGTLHEMIFNVCDNAISYNNRGGHADVSVRKVGDKTVLEVKDDGIGIAPEHQERVFERFYRVDKSRSKERGGTGLGLSIVKHGVLLHGARLSMQSEPGKGTDITIVFD